MEFCENQIQGYQIGLDDLELFKSQLKEKQNEFTLENAKLIERISKLSSELYEDRIALNDLAVQEYKKTGEKKLLCGIGIRVGVALEYDEVKALDWSKKHELCLTLNKREFENIAKSQVLDFVEKKENITVTFPKKIEYSLEPIGDSGI